MCSESALKTGNKLPDYLFIPHPSVSPLSFVCIIVKDAVDELRPIGRSRTLGQFDRLVDGHASGFRYAAFRRPQAQNVSVGGSHPLEAPILGRLFDELIHFLAMSAHAGTRPATKSTNSPTAIAS